MKMNMKHGLMARRAIVLDHLKAGRMKDLMLGERGMLDHDHQPLKFSWMETKEVSHLSLGNDEDLARAYPILGNEDEDIAVFTDRCGRKLLAHDLRERISGIIRPFEPG